MDIKQFWKAVIAQDEEEIRKYFHKDAYVNWHCTDEHFTVDEYIIANCDAGGRNGGIAYQYPFFYAEPEMREDGMDNGIV